MQILVEVKNLFFTELESSGVTLKEKGGTRTLKIIVGDFEAQAIALGLENIKPPRPLTHDFLISLSDISDLKLERLVINDLKQNTFYAELYVSKGGVQYKIDTRPSDGIAVAVRLGLPIYIEEEVFEKVLEEETGTSYTKPSGDLSIQDLEDQLKDAVENEEYEVAAKLRDKIRQVHKKSN